MSSICNKQVKQGVKSYDMFGHVITMNFNQRGNSHQTTFGGCVSIVIYVTMTVYVALNFRTMIFSEGDELSTQTALINPDEIEPILYNQTDLLLFHAIRKQRQGGAQLLLDDELRSYLDIVFSQGVDDWWKSEADGRFTLQEYPVRYCRLEDFGNDAQAEKLFNAWGGITILCPDVPSDVPLYLHGDLSSMVVKHLQFSIRTCNPHRSRLPCKSDEEIRRFVEDLQIDSWTVNQKIDFSVYDVKPVFTVMEAQSTLVIDTSKTLNTILTVRKHNIETEDALLQLGQISREDTFFQIGKTMSRNKVQGLLPGVFYISDLYLQPEAVFHFRKVYGLLDLLGDLGGVTEVLAIGFGLCLLPVSEHLFILGATKQLFLANTEDDSLFLEKKHPRISRKTKTPKPPPEDKLTRLSTTRQRSIKKHRYIKLRTRDKVLLYLSNKLGRCFPRSCWPERKKFTKVFEKGAERIDQELNIIYFMNNLRNLKILLKNSLMKDPEIRMKIKHDEKNLIDLDESTDGPPSDANFGDIGEYKDVEEDKQRVQGGSQVVELVHDQRRKKKPKDDPYTLYATPQVLTEEKRANTFVVNTVGLSGAPPLVSQTPIAGQIREEAAEEQEVVGGSDAPRSDRYHFKFKEPLEGSKKERGSSSRKRARQRHEVYRDVYRERSKVSR